MSAPNVVFSHGQDSGPWGIKIAALAETARGEGFVIDSVDYEGVNDVTQRAAILSEFCKSKRGDLVLVGSSLGAYNVLQVAPTLHAYGVFLLAPAIYVADLPPLKLQAADCPVTIVHGLSDELVPAEHSLRYAREHGATVHLVRGDHRLHDQVPFLKFLFEYFLIHLDMPRMRA
jgi:pimeloyl-ACP methyl ester carboxylesterase